MESLIKNLTEASKVMDAEVLARYRQFAHIGEAKQWLRRELSQLASTALVTAKQQGKELWLKSLFAKLRLQYVLQMGEAAILMQPSSGLSNQQSAAIEVLELLAEENDWERLCQIGAGTYEMFVLRLRAMAALGVTFATPPDEYITRFCTEYPRFSQRKAAIEEEQTWLTLLVSLQTALKSSPMVEWPIKSIANMPNRHVVAVPPQALLRPEYSLRRDRVISFSAVLGLLIVCGAVLWGGPSFKQIAGSGGDNVAPSPATAKPAATRPAPASAASPVATPTIARKVEPRATPEVSERAGFYVIGLASREEASARAEAQKHKQEGLTPIVVYSSNWSGLTPNYYQVVYGIFAQRADTTALRKELEKRGIKTYVMHSGQRARR